MTDVLLFQTDNDGDIRYTNGQAGMSDGLETSVFLSLFGGNERDGGGTDTDHLQWWGNLIEEDEDAKYRSETQHLLRALPAIPANLLRIKDSAERDLDWLLRTIAESVEVTVSMPGVNRIRIQIDIVIDDSEFQFVFTEAWRQAA